MVEIDKELFKKLKAKLRSEEITEEDLIEFYNEYKCILPESITRWENLFS